MVGLLLQVLRAGHRLNSMMVELPSTIKAAAAATSILQQAAALLAEEHHLWQQKQQQKKQEKMQQEQQQQQQQQQQEAEGAAAATAAAAAAGEDEEEDEWEPDFAESHLLTYTGGSLVTGRCSVAAVDATVQLNDAWFSNNQLLVLLLPQQTPSAAAAAAAAAAAKPARAGSKRKSTEPEPDASWVQQRPHEYMLVFSSLLNEENKQLLPWLLEMPHVEGGGAPQYSAVVKAYQVRLAQLKLRPHIVWEQA